MRLLKQTVAMWSCPDSRTAKVCGIYLCVMDYITSTGRIWSSTNLKQVNSITYWVPAAFPSAANHSRRAVGCSEFPSQWPAQPETWTSAANVASISCHNIQRKQVSNVLWPTQLTAPTLTTTGSSACAHRISQLHRKKSFSFCLHAAISCPTLLIFIGINWQHVRIKMISHGLRYVNWSSKWNNHSSQHMFVNVIHTNNKEKTTTIFDSCYCWWTDDEWHHRLPNSTCSIVEWGRREIGRDLQYAYEIVAQPF